MRQAIEEPIESSLCSDVSSGVPIPWPPPCEPVSSMVELLLLLMAALIVIVAFADDDDLPGPRRCFAHAVGAR